MVAAASVPIESGRSVPIAIIGHIMPSSRLNKQRRITAKEIEEIAIEAFDNRKAWIIFQDLIDKFGMNKPTAQSKLKRYCGNDDTISCRTKVLFAPGNYKPQRYYPVKLKAKVMEHLFIGTSVPVDPTGVSLSRSCLSSCYSSKSPLSNCLESIIIQSLEDYVLPLLQTVPPNIHNMHFKTRINAECYSEQTIQDLSDAQGNRGKQLYEVIGNSMVLYTFYPSGSVIVQVKCSNNPFKLETETDHGRILAFIGQVRDRLIIFLNDRHERIVPDIMEWYLTECDINRDIKASNWMQFTGTKIQVRHLDHLFRIYVKSMGRNTIQRIEEERRFHNKPYIEVLNDTFNPNEKTQKLLYQILDKLGELNIASGGEHT
jgi:hypothetical protein